MQPLALTENSAEADPALAERQFAAIVEQHQRPLVQLAFRLVGHVEDAKDLAQWAFAKLWLNRHRLDAEREAFHYLRKVVVNLCIDHLRRRGRHEPEVAFDENLFAHDLTNPLQQLERQELQGQLLRCIDALKPKQKATIVLRDIEGYSIEEAAEMLACTKTNVLCNLHLARENVRRKMQQWVETT
ncbi:RNA polymerase sigma factor [candidate division KSB1 bacterium]|nr:RNA polymerase sigma factor [candidate division KSB1 bacterium]